MSTSQHNKFEPILGHMNHDLELSLKACKEYERLLAQISQDNPEARLAFFKSKEAMPFGILVGVNLQTDTPIYVDFLDRRILENGNTCILGRAGKGHGTIIRAPSGETP